MAKETNSDEAERATGRARGTGATISFGLVTIPVTVHPATSPSAGVSFHLLHAKDGVRLRQQLVCPQDDEVVPRTEAVKGFEFEKGRHVTFTEAELKKLDHEATRGIEIQEFVPPASVDRVYCERSDYLAPGRGGEKPFALFVRTLEDLELAAIAVHAARGKDHLVMLRPMAGRLVMHQLLHADEVRPIDALPAATKEVREPELKLARELVGHLTARAFEPEKYQDEVRARVRALIDRKVSGEEVVEEPSRPASTKVVDLMAALKASLAARSAAATPAAKSKPKPRARSLKRAG